ncbi:MAG: hypothetical protein ACON4H_07435 [Rubripirellula sp.]
MKRIVTHLSLFATSAILATGCVPVRHNLPPEQRMMEVGPGVGGPGPGVLGEMSAPSAADLAAAVAPEAMPMAQSNAAQGSVSDGEIGLVNYTHTGAPSDPSAAAVAAPPTLQVSFRNPDGMQVRYDATGNGGFDSEPLIAPARQNFPQGGLYRVKLTNIPNREGVELYPTVELAYANPRTGAYLAHNSVPVEFTEEDFDQVLTGNFVTKVIYLPDPEFQGPALAGIDTLVSTRLDPGVDPIVEADRRGSILAIIRLGDKDVEMSGAGADSLASMMTAPIPGLPAPYAPAMTDGCGHCQTGAPSGAPMAAQYGMTMSATPIGIPGPPHLPLGHPAGLQKHVMRNHTAVKMPRPSEKIRIDVRNQPGYSYPATADRIRITSQNLNP